MSEIIARSINQLRAKRKCTPIPINEEGTPKDVQPELHETTTCAVTNKDLARVTIPDESLQTSRT